MSSKITAEDHVDDLIERLPELNVFLMKRGIMCIQCGDVFWGTLGELIESKGLDVQAILSEVNENLGLE